MVLGTNDKDEDAIGECALAVLSQIHSPDIARLSRDHVTVCFQDGAGRRVEARMNCSVFEMMIEDYSPSRYWIHLLRYTATEGILATLNLPIALNFGSNVPSRCRHCRTALSEYTPPSRYTVSAKSLSTGLQSTSSRFRYAARSSVCGLSSWPSGSFLVLMYTVKDRSWQLEEGIERMTEVTNSMGITDSLAMTCIVSRRARSSKPNTGL